MLNKRFFVINFMRNNHIFIFLYFGKKCQNFKRFGQDIKMLCEKELVFIFVKLFLRD